jgi:hypothetical protein
MKIILILLLTAVSIIALVKCESAKISNIEIEWTNNGNHTTFMIKSTLEKSFKFKLCLDWFWI